MALVYNEFVGTPIRHTDIARDEFLNMKCYSLELKDLERHYDLMSKQFYILGGIDDLNLKQVFFHSFPDSLVTEAKKLFKLQKLELKDLTIANIYEHLIDYVKRMCNQHKFFEDLQITSKMLAAACNKGFKECKNNGF